MHVRIRTQLRSLRPFNTTDAYRETNKKTGVHEVGSVAKRPPFTLRVGSLLDELN